MVVEKGQLEALKIDRMGDEKSVRAWPWFLGLGLVVVVIACLVWFLVRSPMAKVNTVVVQEESTSLVQAVLNASGYVTARRQATVSSKITGKIVEVNIEEGLVVKSGEVLATLDDALIRAGLELTRARLGASQKAMEETRVLLHESELNLVRVRNLIAEGIANQAELDRAEAETASFEARLARQKEEVVVADRELAMREIELDDTSIRAPFDGVVVSKNAQPGEMISPMSAGGSFTRTGICTIVDMDSLEIEVDVNESYINRVSSGQAAEAILDAYPDWSISAHVIAIVPTADRQKATVEVRIGFDELDPRILPDMGVKVTFLGEQDLLDSSPAIVFRVPRNAVFSENNKDFVWVVANNAVEKRAVGIAQNDGSSILINTGLAAGERIAVDAPNGLKQGDRVKEVNP